MPFQEGKEFCWAKYMEHNRKIDSYAYHNTEWAHSLYKKMENWDYSGYIETGFITKEDIKLSIQSYHKWVMENKLDSPLIFPPALVEKLVNETAEDFNKWFSNLKS